MVCSLLARLKVAGLICGVITVFLAACVLGAQLTSMLVTVALPILKSMMALHTGQHSVEVSTIP